MGEKSSNKTQKKDSWYVGHNAEFKKIIWPDKNTLAKQTVAVVSASVILGLIITIVDVIAKYGIDLLVK